MSIKIAIIGFGGIGRVIFRTAPARPDIEAVTINNLMDAATYVIDNMVKVLSWYDNETGYSHRVADLAAMVGTRQ